MSRTGHFGDFSFIGSPEVAGNLMVHKNNKNCNQELQQGGGGGRNLPCTFWVKADNIGSMRVPFSQVNLKLRVLSDVKLHDYKTA